MALISVVVPVYNVEKYIHQCIDSILSQTFTDLELILVDDGSPDRCPQICDRYAEQDQRIHVIHQKNGGLSAARNAGIDWAFANSDSQWITFVDSDDWVHPELLEHLYRAAQKLKTSVSVCSYLETIDSCLVADIPKVSYELWDVESFYVEKNINSIIAWAKLYRKSCFSDIRYPVGKIHEDEYITHQILFAHDKLAFVPEALYYYRINSNGITKSNWTLKRLDAFPAFESQILFFKQHNFQRAKKRAVYKYIGLIEYTYVHSDACFLEDGTPVKKFLQKNRAKDTILLAL